MSTSLPPDVLDIIAVRSCDHWLEYMRSWAAVSSRFRDFRRYLPLIGKGARFVVPRRLAVEEPEEEEEEGLEEESMWSRAQPRCGAALAPEHSVHAAAMLAAAEIKHGGSGVVVVRDGVYREPLRITGAVAILAENENAVTLEGVGWEPALTFAGLGAAAKNEHDVIKLDTSVGTGERCAVFGMNFRNRNEANATCVLVARGAPILHRCLIRGSIWCGGEAAPVLRDGTRCTHSRGVGVRVTDKGMCTLRRGCVLTSNRGAGVCADRGGHVDSISCSLTGNGQGAVLASTTASVSLVETATGPPVEVQLRVGRDGKDGAYKVRLRMWESMIDWATDEDLLHGRWEPLFDSDDFEEMLELANATTTQ
ncbi:hypothetical protein NFJ02_01g37310 [Pycnococcus provasolii]